MLVVGANGLIGAALVDRLAEDGHEVILAVRDEDAAAQRWPQHRRIRVDFLDDDAMAALAPALQGVDVLVNAVGIFAEVGPASFEAIHVKGPCTLFDAAARAGVPRLIQVSALGAAPDAATAYWRSKAHGDACARRYPGTVTIVQPSLVFAPEGASSGLFLRLTAMPWVLLPAANAQVQPLHLADLVAGLATLVSAPSPPPVIAAVGPRPLALRDYLRTLGTSIGLRPRIAHMPARGAQIAARCLQHLPGRWLTPDALAMLAQGSHADAAPWQALLRQPARDPAQFIAPARAAGLRRAALLANLLPLLRLAISLSWLVTAWVSAFVYPRAASLALLERTHVPPSLAPAALYTAAALDALLGLAMWWPRWRALAYRAQIALIVLYTLVITFWLPEFWAHPYGPLLKNVPMLALIYALLRLEAPHGLRRR